MESLLPSEIARLVYGYLIDEKCDAAAQSFLETSEFLKECNAAQKKGRKFNTRVMGLCLVDILNLYTDAVAILNNYKDQEELSSAELIKTFQELRSVLFVDEINDKNVSKTVFLRISIPPKGKSSGSPESSEKKEGEEKEVDSKEAEKKKDQTDVDTSITANLGKTTVPNLDDFDLNMLQTLLDNTALHERLAENINKAIDSRCVVHNAKADEKKIIETVLHSTEADPIFDELLHMLVAPRAEDTTTPEDTDKENGDPTEERMDVDHSSCKEDETVKRLEAESKMAIEGILAGNKKIQQETPVPLPSPSNLIPIDKSQIPPHLLGGIKEVSSLPPNSSVSNAVVIPLNSTTPLQPIEASNIPIFSFASPVQPVRVLKKVAQVGSRGGMQPRRRRIAPKSEAASLPPVIHVQVQNHDFNQETVAAQHVPEILKKPVARTRGGRSRGSRGVRSITPQIAKLNDDKINVVFVESKAKPGVKTRSGYRRQQKSVTQNDSDQTDVQSSDTADELNKESDALSEESHPVNCESPQKSREDPIAEQSTQDKEELPTTSSEEQPEKTLEDHQRLPMEQLSQSNLESRVDDCNPETCKDSPEKSTDVSTSTSISPSSSAHSEPSDMAKNGPTTSTIEPSTSTNIEPSTNIVPSDEQSSAPNDLSKSGIEKKELCEDSTPEQQGAVAKFKPRISLSTPRRGSHIRVLDFKTPDKGKLEVRKAHTSPKVYSKMKQLDKLDNVKRGILKSPEQNNEVGKKKSWDADLRKCFASDAMDIPTSVGLKRKAGSKKDTKGKKKGGKSAKQSDVDETDGESPTKPASTLCSSNEDLVKQIEKEVRDVVGDEELSLNTSGNIETLSRVGKSLQCVGVGPDHNSSCSDMEIEEIGNAKTDVTVPTTNAKESNVDEQTPNESPCTPRQIDENIPKPNENLISAKDISSEIEINVSSSKESLSPPDNAPVKTSSPALVSSENANICSGLEKETCETKSNHSFSQIFSATPMKLSVSPSRENSIGQITPTTKLLMSHLGTVTSPVLSPIAHSYSNLESILITEGNRLEQEKALRAVQAITKLSESLDESKSPENSQNLLKPASSNETLNSSDKCSPSEISNIKTLNMLQTPAKPFPGYTPQGIPVDMTPLTKVLHSETKILSTALVTPTLPATPKPPTDLRTPYKADSLNELPVKAPKNENVVSKSKKKESGPKGDSMPFLGNNQKKQSTLNFVKENTAQSKILNSDKNKGSPATQKPKVKKSGVSTSPKSGASVQETVKVCKTPRVKLLPKNPTEFLIAQQMKLQRKNLKTKELASDSLVTPKNVTEEENKLESSSRRQRNENEEVMDVEEQSINEKKTRGMKMSTPKRKRVKASPAIETSTARKRRGGALQKSPTGKKTSKFNLVLLKEEEQVLRECLQNAKAKLFGIDSSDSDSSDECEIKETINHTGSNKSKRNSSTGSVQENELVNSHLFTARDRLKKLESVSMLDSSDSSDDSLVMPSSSNPAKDAEGKKMKAVSIQAVDSKVELTRVQTSIGRRMSQPDNPVGSEIRKQGSPQKNDNSKLPSNVRDKDESCESFPTLYLSEESNMSLQSESHTVKSMRMRKSPSAGSDQSLLKKAIHLTNPVVSSLLVRPDKEKQYFKPSNENYTTRSNVALQNVPSASRDLIGATDSPQIKTVKGLDAYETVIHQTPSKPIVLSNEEKQGFGEYLNNYTFSFTLDAEGQDDLLCKTLRTSPFYTIFELNSNNSSRHEHRKSIPDRIERDDKCKSPPSRERSRKRHRSDSSDDESRKFGRFRGGYRRGKGYRGRPKPWGRRRDYSPERPRPYSSPRYQSSPHYRTHSYGFDRKRLRRESIETNDSGKRDEKRPYKKMSNEKSDISPHSNMPTFFGAHSSKKVFNESFRSSKSSESDRLLVDHSFRGSESPRDAPDKTNTALNERTHVNIVKSKEEILRFNNKQDREDGELSDSSELQPLKSPPQLTATTAAARKELIAFMRDKSRTSLLDKIDLDRFLTILHGEEK